MPPTNPDLPPAPLPGDHAAAMHVNPRVEEPVPPPDAGEPMGARDSDRPSMLGRSFFRAELTGMAVGLVVALLAHWQLSHLYLSGNPNGWSWALAGVGGVAVGGGITLFLYGVSTDRSDTGPKRRGRADVSTEGEDHRSTRRRRRPAPSARRPS